MRPAEQEHLDNVFSYHSPVGDQATTYQEIRAAGKALAEAIYERVPAGPDREMAVDHVRAAVMWANAGIACTPPPAPEPEPYAGGAFGDYIQPC